MNRRRADAAIAYVETPIPRWSHDMKKLRVMIVEDDGLIAMMLADVIEELGHEVCAVEASEREAVSSALREKPDMMIIDANLRDGSGLKAIETILASGPMPHILVSGDAASVRTLRPQATVLQKPYFEIDLIKAMRRALGASALR
jgi:CheY-like chemotaxis protein